VTTDKIDDDAVTLEKMQNIPTDTILGRDTAGTGDIETLTLNEPLFFDAPGTIGVSSANTDDAGIVEFATAAEVAAEDFDLVFSPGRAVGLPGVGKAWASILNSGSASIESSYNVDSVNRTGTGVVVVTLTNTMANDDYVVQVTMGENAPAALRFARITDRTTTAFTVNTRGDSAQADVDFFVLVHGALA
jgi:hypothetical protein